MSDKMISTEPATGNQIWRGKVGDVEQAMERALAAKTAWARESTARRMELLRRFANEVLKHADPFAELIARETGKSVNVRRVLNILMNFMIGSHWVGCVWWAIGTRLQCRPLSPSSTFFFFFSLALHDLLFFSGNISSAGDTYMSM